MPKRKLDETPVEKEEEEERSVKRARPLFPDHLSSLSDELLLRILSFLQIPTLILCQTLSRRFYRVSGDSQLWKAAYYSRFVLPRAAKIPGIRDAGAPSVHLLYSSKVSKWLEEEHLVRKGKQTNWKRQYKIRHNWSRGSCVVSEIDVSERPPVPPLLVRLHDGIIITADSIAGLRAWSSKSSEALLATTRLEISGTSDNTWLPTSLAIDTSIHNSEEYRVVVGFEDGRFSIYGLSLALSRFKQLYTKAPSSNGILSAVAYTFPYLLTMTDSQRLSLYKFPEEPEGFRTTEDFKAPRLLYSLTSHTVWPPLSLSIRSASLGIVASIAYAVPTYLSGWSVGIQELLLTADGELIESRLASATNDGFRSLSERSELQSPSPSPPSSAIPRRIEASPTWSKPTSLSYTHPYLLVSHPDNTLMLYLVTSTSTSLSISSGSRLWGHTSSVSGAHVGGRGKAVSVSSRGELRVWELEGRLSSSTTRRRLLSGELSVRIRPEVRSSTHEMGLISDAISQRGTGLGLAVGHRIDEVSVARGWVGFDEENVIVLREKSQGNQALLVYDFT